MHWARIIDVPLQRDANGEPVLRFELGSVRFTRNSSAERLDAVHMAVADVERVMAGARAAGCAREGVGPDRGFVLGGVRFVPRAPVTLRDDGA